MGMHNRITSERFEAIKRDVKSSLSDAEVMNKHQIKKTTLIAIRRSQTFYEYRLRTDSRLKNYRFRPIIVAAEKSGLLFEDYAPTKMRAMTEKEESDRLDREAERTARVFGVMFAIIILILIVALIALIITPILFLIVGGTE